MALRGHVWQDLLDAEAETHICLSTLWQQVKLVTLMMRKIQKTVVPRRMYYEIRRQKKILFPLYTSFQSLSSHKHTRSLKQENSWTQCFWITQHSDEVKKPGN